MKKFTIICMFPAFNYETNLYSREILKKFEYVKNKNDESIDIFLIGSFIKEDDYIFIKNLKNKIKLMWLSEPIIYHFKYPFKLIKENKIDYIYGCVMDNIKNNRFKLPLYINYYKGWEQENYYSVKYFKDLNNNKIEKEELIKKEFCTLIARHDNWNTRKNIYNKLINIDKITCPSQLLNNFDNEKMNKIGKKDFLKNYIFNLCPENSKYNFPGYITEKLMDCCVSGCIPIYCGKLDENDKKVFNMDRIIFYESDNESSLYKCYRKVKELYEDKDKLLEFYNQDIFNEKSSEEVNRLINNFKNFIKTME